MKIFILIFWAFTVSYGHAQARIERQRIEDKSVIYDRQAEERFAFQVKTIDEFMERFNDSESTLLRKYLDVSRPGVIKSDRIRMLKALFEKKSFVKDSLKTAFVASVCDSLNPQFLNFFQKNWYAQAQCLFQDGARNKYITLVLKVLRTANGGSKWVIAGASEYGISKQNKSTVRMTGGDTRKGLNPYSHVMDFTELEDALEDKINIESYLDEGFLTLKNQPIIEAILSGKIRFNYVQEITYHFLQIDGWIFSVQNFKRMTRQSGWLITQLQPADNEEKDFYKQAVLALKVTQ